MEGWWGEGGGKRNGLNEMEGWWGEGGVKGDGVRESERLVG